MLRDWIGCRVTNARRRCQTGNARVGASLRPQAELGFRGQRSGKRAIVYRLYYYPSNASLAPHFLLEEIGAPHELVAVRVLGFVRVVWRGQDLRHGPLASYFPAGGLKLKSTLPLPSAPTVTLPVLVPSFSCQASMS